jgi:hypothetical protein
MSVAIDAELAREDHNSIPATVIRRGLKPLNAKTDPQTRFNWVLQVDVFFVEIV